MRTHPRPAAVRGARSLPLPHRSPMRTSLVLAGLLSAAALLAVAPASAQCLHVDGVGCVPTCPAGAYRDADQALGDALPPLPFTVECTL